MGERFATLLEEYLDLAIDVRGLFVPGRSLQNHLGRYCQHLYVWTHDDTYRVRLVGTATPVHFLGRIFLLCTKHQLGDSEPSDVGLMYPDGSIFVTSSGYRVFNEHERGGPSDVYDIVAFDFTEPVSKHPALRPYFFEFTEVPPDVPSTFVLALVVAGFASSEQVYELEEKNHIGSRKRNLTAVPDGQPEDQCLLRAKFVEKLEFDPDGLSGAPVFTVQFRQNRQPKAYLAGVLLRANREYLYFLKAGYLRSFLESFAS